jgi:hypothetical protein
MSNCELEVAGLADERIESLPMLLGGNGHSTLLDQQRYEQVADLAHENLELNAILVAVQGTMI